LNLLGLNNNQLSGSIPSELGSLISLTGLDLSNNTFTGTIPPELGNLSLLTGLGLSGNSLAGTIPVELGNLANLEILNLKENSLSGELPVLSFPNLTTLDLSNNELTGILTDGAVLTPLIQNLNLSNNQFYGSVPSILNNTLTLTNLELQNNVFSALPDLTALTSTFINVAGNRIPWADIVANISVLNSYSGTDINDVSFLQFYTYPLTIDNLTPQAGEAVNISVTSDHANNTFQWYKDGEPIDTETTASLALTSINEFDKGEYYCLVGNTNDLTGLYIESESFILDPNVTERKYASSVVSVSSEISSVFGGSVQALGLPNSNTIDIESRFFGVENLKSGNGWIGSTSNNKEIIDVAFDTPSPVNTVWLYRTGFGFVDSVLFKNAATGTYDLILPSGALQMDFPMTSFDVSEVRIIVDNTNSDNFNPISLDAVAIGVNNTEIPSPTNLVLTQLVNDTIVNISWSINLNGLQESTFDSMRYVIERSLSLNSGFAAIDSISYEGLNSTSGYSDRSAPPDDFVYYRVRAYQDNGRVSQYSNVLEVQKCEPTFILPIDKSWNSYTSEGAFGAFGVNSYVEITLSQNQPQVGISYDLSDYTGSWYTAFFGPASVFTRLTEVCGDVNMDPADAGFGEDVSLTLDYSITGDSLVIQWFNANNSFTETTVFKPNALEPIQNSASEVFAINIGGQVQIDWNDNSLFESGFSVERAEGTPVTFTSIATTAQDENRLMDNTVNVGTTYFYRVLTLSDSGPSVASDTASITINTTLFTKVLTGDVVNDVPSNTYSGHFADYDNDGDQDLYTSNADFIGEGDPALDNYKNYFYQNDGSGNFTKIVNSPIAEDEFGSRGAAWGDLNHDGWLDLVVPSIGNAALPEAQNPYYNSQVYFNNMGTFTKATELSRSSDGLSLTDFNNDGAVDVIMGDLFGRLGFYQNTGEGLLSLIPDFILKDSSLNVSTWNIHSSDFNNDQLPDLLLSGDQGARIFLGDGALSFDSNAILNTSINSRGSAVSDIDLDGDLDVILANGSPRAYINNGDSTFTELDDLTVFGESLSIGRVFTFSDYDNDGDEDFLGFENQFPVLFSSNGDGTFVRLDQSVLPFTEVSNLDALAVADINGDGYQDIYVSATNFNNPTLSDSHSLYTNNGTGNSWLRVSLKGANSDLFGFGSTINVKTSSGW